MICLIKSWWNTKFFVRVQLENVTLSNFISNFVPVKQKCLDFCWELRQKFKYGDKKKKIVCLILQIYYVLTATVITRECAVGNRLQKVPKILAFLQQEKRYNFWWAFATCFTVWKGIYFLIVWHHQDWRQTRRNLIKLFQLLHQPHFNKKATKQKGFDVWKEVIFRSL